MERIAEAMIEGWAALGRENGFAVQVVQDRNGGHVSIAAAGAMLGVDVWRNRRGVVRTEFRLHVDTESMLISQGKAIEWLVAVPDLVAA